LEKLKVFSTGADLGGGGGSLTRVVAGVPEHAVGRPLAKTNLAHVDRLDPCGRFRLRNRGGGSILTEWRAARRRLADHRLEHRSEFVEKRVVESGADASGVDELSVHEVRELQRAEVRPPSLGTREAHDDELVALLRLDFEPEVAAARAIGRIGALRQNPLEPHLLHLREERLAFGLDVVEGMDRAELRQRGQEKLLADSERQRSKVEILEREKVEREERRRQLDRGALDLRGIVQRPSLLQPREARLAGVVEADDLAVDDDLVERKRVESARDFGEDGRIVVPLARDEHRFAARLAGDQAIAVELELEDPIVAGKRFLGRLGQHRLDCLGIDPVVRRLYGLDGFAQIGDRAAAELHFIDRQAGQHRGLLELIAGRLDVRVALLDEQPVLLALLHLHERPVAVKLVAAQLEEELALGESLTPILERDPLAAVPHDHAARAVVALGDDTLEVPVLERVILDLHGETLVLRVVRRPLGHRPRAEDPVHLQAEVEVQPAGGVLVHHEQPAGDGGHRSHRLGCRVRRPLGTVRAEVVYLAVIVAAFRHTELSVRR
jgi:hypothetical protein